MATLTDKSYYKQVREKHNQESALYAQQCSDHQRVRRLEVSASAAVQLRIVGWLQHAVLLLHMKLC